jgi:hypothetical protein
MNSKNTNSISKDTINLKKQQSEILCSNFNIEENTSKQKAKLSKASYYSSEDKAILESEFNSKSSAAASIKNLNLTTEQEISNSDDSEKIVNNKLDENIINNSIKNYKKENNKENEKAENLCVSQLKAYKNPSGHSTPKSKLQIISEVNKNYIINNNEENANKNNINPNNNTLNINIITNIKESSSTNNLNNNINDSKTPNNNPELHYFLESGKSDPRSSIISTTSCSVSPNISYNQEIENHSSSNNISNTNCKETCKASDISEKRRSIYTKRDISRFDFVLNNTSNNQNTNKIGNENIVSRKSSDNNTNTNNKEYEKPNEEIPEFVFDVLNKKISRFSFFKRFKNEYDIPDSIFLEDSFIDKNKDESWADFIKMNLNP